MIKSKNILVTTLGTSWLIMPEIVSFVNHSVYQLLKNNTHAQSFYNTLDELGINRVDEIWAVITNETKSLDCKNDVVKWQESLTGVPIIRFFSCSELIDLSNERQCAGMTDLIFRTVLHAKNGVNKGKLILCLTGGRKNMSADMQRAVELFGCDLFFHVADVQTNGNNFSPSTLPEVWSADIANRFTPVVIQKNVSENPILFVPEPLMVDDYPIDKILNNNYSDGLLREMNGRVENSKNNYYNFYLKKIVDSSASNFYFLHQLHPTKINTLQTSVIHYTSTDLYAHWQFIKKMPKADLHFHFGGCLTIAETIRVAYTCSEEVNYYIKTNKCFANWLDTVKLYNDSDFYKLFRQKETRNLFPEIPQPYTVLALILLFKNDPDRLGNIIYEKFCDNNLFFKIGIEDYEKLGDIQGSAILQCEETIRETCRIIKEYCLEENIKYLEIRCSPCNYTCGNLSPEKVIEILHTELSENQFTIFRLIIIASRHGNLIILQNHIKLFLELKKQPLYENFIVGFDIAGDEEKMKPRDIRINFEEILQNCNHMTIHAGETQDVENIWEAVYLFNADRIGHGLSLIQKPDLIKRFADRKIYIELCPSSNYQIVGYQDFRFQETTNEKEYPLLNFMKDGLKVTINTDNRGISKTSLTNDYIKAALMSKEGLSYWQILQLIKNSFTGSFLPRHEKHQLIMAAEKEIYSLIAEE